MKLSIVFILQSLSSAEDFSYKTNGADWPAASPDCALEQQSPIDLKTEATMWDGTEQYTKTYKDLENVMGEWTHDTTNKWKTDSKTHGFTSDYAQKTWGAPSAFNAVQFHWHSGSEHTVDGVRMDLEVHTVHLADPMPDTGFKYAALGLMFDRTMSSKHVTKEQVKAIDDFFDDLLLTKVVDTTAAKIRYGTLIQALDTERRYVYKGSVTTPPCATSVYWNVLQTVYPVKQHHLDAFQIHMGRNTATDYNLRLNGNWRVIQKTDTQELKRIGPAFPSDGLHPGYIAMIVVIVFFLVGVMAFAGWVWMSRKQSRSDKINPI